MTSSQLSDSGDGTQGKMENPWRWTWEWIVAEFSERVSQLWNTDTASPPFCCWSSVDHSSFCPWCLTHRLLKGESLIVFYKLCSCWLAHVSLKWNTAWIPTVVKFQVCSEQNELPCNFFQCNSQKQSPTLAEDEASLMTVQRWFSGPPWVPCPSCWPWSQLGLQCSVGGARALSVPQPSRRVWVWAAGMQIYRLLKAASLGRQQHKPIIGSCCWTVLALASVRLGTARSKTADWNKQVRGLLSGSLQMGLGATWRPRPESRKALLSCNCGLEKSHQCGQLSKAPFWSQFSEKQEHFKPVTEL